MMKLDRLPSVAKDMIRIAVVAAVALAVSACASTDTVMALMPRTDMIHRPALDTPAEAELGDTIVEKGKFTTYDGLVLKNQLLF